MTNVLDVLKERGFVEQVSDEERLRAVLEEKSISLYIGYDPSASSLHCGSLVTLMVLAHMQRAGHRPIPLIGGGTGMIGDPSGRTELRQLLTVEQIDENAEALKKQISRFIDFSDDKAVMLNNADWLRKLNYVEFLRDIGRHFSVNRMLAAEAYKQRLERGLSFIEFNYQLLQAYDFLHLFKYENCLLQCGGNDQWGNILAGVELIRRVEGGEAFALTFPLLTTSSGAKMGKTAAGAVWLDPDRLSPYDFYQYWVNAEDADVVRFLKLFTFLPMEEINELAKLKDAEINRAKRVLAHEVTSVVHGKEEADKAEEASKALFGAGNADIDIPTTEISGEELKAGVSFAEVFQRTGLCASASEVRRLIQQGGAYINDERVDSFDQMFTLADLEKGSATLRAGKKRYRRIVVKE